MKTDLICLHLRYLRELLLYSYGLCQIPRLIYVAASPDGDVIREQLQRDDRENRRQQIARRREFDHVIRNN